MKKLRKINDNFYEFYCPGCKHEHPYEVPRWTWNESLENPTFSPSLLCNSTINEGKFRCHLFVENGCIKYCSDCFHELKGQTVEMVVLDEENDYWINKNGKPVHMFGI